ncbi:MAG TPA: hypothetical protein VEB22_00620, partial [Phycisphaerales bacterium]|nr:hypothetical protein [Phycisphaerales bacterium]
VFLPGPYGGIVALDATSLRQVDRLGIGTSTEHATVRPDGRLMLIPGHREIAVRDMHAKAWRAPLAFDQSVYAPRSIHFSADGRTVCAVFQSGGRSVAPGGTPTPIVFQLGVWRLPESLAAEPGK